MRFDPSLTQRFSDWQRNLTLSDKLYQDAIEVASRQRVLAESVRGGPAMLVNHLREALSVNEFKLGELPPLPRQVSPAEFRDPPFQLERELFDSWNGKIRRREAANPLFWTLCHMKWMSSGRMGDRIEGALLGTLANGAAAKTDDAATRNLLRRIGGLPHVRGKVSVLTDCPLSRAWWRGQISLVSAQDSFGELEPERAHKVLHANNDAWARLVGHSVRRVTVINHPRIRAALICQYRESSREISGLPAQELQDVIRLIARHGPSVAFDCLEWSELVALVSSAITQVRLGAQVELNESINGEYDTATNATRQDRKWPNLKRFFGR